MKKIGLYIGLIASVLALYSHQAFPEDVFYQYNDSSYDYINNDPYQPESDLSEYHSEEKSQVTHEYSQERETAEVNHNPEIYNTYDFRLPENIPGHGEKVIIVDPKLHAWGAYSASGGLIRQGLASAGAKWCSDLRRPCRTKTGVFRIQSLGDSDCISSRYPLGEGGAPMPYCMYFNGNQGLHGSNQVAAANLSHGCVRLSVSDAEWLRYHFAERGTKVIVKSY